MKTGNIQYINKEKGFGFIKPSGKDGSVKEKDVFFHFSKVVDPDFESLKVDDKVDYTEEESNKGNKVQAVDVVAYQK